MCSYTAMACYFHQSRLCSASCLSFLSLLALYSCAYVSGPSILIWNIKCFFLCFISCLVCVICYRNQIFQTSALFLLLLLSLSFSSNDLKNSRSKVSERDRILLRSCIYIIVGTCVYIYQVMEENVCARSKWSLIGVLQAFSL